MLILDLDDTLFQTNSMRADIFEPAIGPIQKYYEDSFGLEKALEVVQDLWQIPFDMVIQKHQIPPKIQNAYLDNIENIPYQLEISPFEDYAVLKAMSLPKILVTTGFPKLQYAKIEALNIQDDFEAIFVDNPRAKDRKFKKGIFQEFLADRTLAPQDVWVIGDNPDSEIKAGKELGMNTIQRLKPRYQKSIWTDYTIRSFEELSAIIV